MSAQLRTLSIMCLLSLFPALAFAGAGDIDCTFGSQGSARIDYSNSYDSGASAAAVYMSGTHAGKIVLAGYRDVGGSDWAFLIARMNPDGSIDTSFGTNGWKVVNIYTGSNTFDAAWGVAIQSDDKIVVSGKVNSGGRDDLGIIRLDASGNLDTTFSGDGIFARQMGTGTSNYTDVVIRPSDGHIFVVGSRYATSNYLSSVAVVNTSGGYVGEYTADYSATSNEGFNGVALDANGNVIAVGYGNNGTNNTPTVSRFASGSPAAAAFNKWVDFGGTYGGFDDAAVQSDGKIVAGGQENIGGNTDYALVRLNASDGSFDTTFSGDGMVALPDISGGDEYGDGIMIQPDGNIVIGGYTSSGYGAARLSASGILDTSFSSDGWNIQAWGGWSYAYGLTAAADGNILVYGTTEEGATRDFGVMKFLASSTSNMIYCSSTVEQSSGTVAPGDPNVDIIRYAINVSGTVSPQSVSQLQFNTTGSTAPASDISSARFYYTGTSSTFSTATPFGSVVSTPSGSYTVNGSQPLQDGTNYFWLAYNLSGSATSTNFIDAQGPEATFTSWGAKTPLITNPPGNRQILSGVTSQTVSPGTPFGDEGGNPQQITSTMIVSDSGTITDMNVLLNISHTWTGDVIVDLTSPAGTTVRLVDQPGVPAIDTDGCSEAFAAVTLDDSGGSSIEDACPITSGGTYTPNNPLSAFNGQNVNGTWTLTVTDGYSGFDDGVLNSWTLEYTKLVACVEPDVPTVSATPSSVCPNASSTLNISGTLSDATAWQIYTGSCGGTNIGSTATGTYFVSPSSTTTYYVRGEGGCTTPGTCGTATVIASDSSNPSITCPADQTVNADGSGQGILADYTGLATSSDNCDASPGISQSPASGATINTTTTVTLTATDASSNISTCTLDVSIVDVTPPVFSGVSANITVNTDPGLSTAVVSWTAPTANDNVDGAITPVRTTGLASGSAFPVGTTTVTYTATDAATNSSTASFTVTVNDNEAPVISGVPANITVNTDPGLSTAVVSWTAPTANDNVDGAVTPVQTAGPASGSAFPVGTTTITYTATDAATNSTTASFTVTVNDNEAPIFSGVPSNITVNTDPGLSTAVVSWTAPTANDNVDGAVTPVQTAGPASGSAFPVGTTTITYTATDAATNSTTASFTVTVNDNEAPIFSGVPSNITVNTDPGLSTAVVSWTAPTANDNVDGAVTPVQTAGPASGSAFPVGTTTITYTATDAATNSTTASFTVTVNDNEAPIFSGVPSNITVNTDPGLSTAVVSWTAPTANDNVDGAVTPVQTAGPASGSAFPVGTTTITYTATDAATNSTTASFTVTVNDNEAPIFSGVPSNITVNTDPGLSTAVVSWTAPTANDNVDGAVTPVQTAGPASGSAFPVGTTTITYTATDAATNSATASFTVTVNDNEAPVFSGVPANITVNTDPGLSTAVVSWTAPTANDNVDGAITPVRTTGLASGSAFPVGTTTVTYTATDAATNSSTASFTVIVNDDEAPVISGMPTNITVNTDPGLSTAVVSWTAPTVTDNIDNPLIPSVVSSPTTGLGNGSAFPPGITTVTYNATDSAGNSTSVSFTVTVIDDEPPVFTGVPSDITVTTERSTIKTASVFWTEPTATDNVDGTITPIQITGLMSGSDFPVGTTIITYTATDTAGNSSSASFNVTVIQREFPWLILLPGLMSPNKITGGEQ